MTNGRIQHIDVWRFIAIAFVLFSHVLAYSHPWYATVAPDLVATVQKLGVLGVRIFFCISGFVICRAMMREAQESGAVSMKAFYIRRIFRILPAFVLYFLFVAMLNWFGVFELTLSQFLKAGAFLCNVSQIGPYCGWALDHTWSLAYEEQFYLLFPLLFVILGLSRKKGFLLILFLALIPVYFIAHRQEYMPLMKYIGEPVFLLAGCLFALYWNSLQPILKRLPVVVWIGLAFPIYAMSTLILPPRLAAFFPFVLSGLICIVVFATPVHNKLVQKIFTNSFFSHLGRMTYSIYLWQQLATADYGFASPIIALGLVALTFVFAHYSYQYFELPFIRRGNRLAAQYIAPMAILINKVKHPNETLSKTTI